MWYNYIEYRNAVVSKASDQSAANDVDHRESSSDSVTSSTPSATPWHESLDRLSKLSRSLSRRISLISSQENKNATEYASNVLLCRYVSNAETLCLNVSDALDALSSELRSQYNVLDSEEEAQRIVRELQTGLKEKMEGGNGDGA